MSELLALGVSHKTAPLELRERLALTEGRAVGVLSELTRAERIHEAAAISTCNRTELYLVVSDPVEAESTALGVLARQAEIRPTELLGHLYSLRARRRRPPPLPGHRRARLDDHRRGRDPGPGQARLRAGAGRGGDRADPQPPLPRRARRRQARARRRPGSARRASRSPRSRSSWRSARSATSPSRRVLVVGAGETAELVARALAARGVEHRLHRQPPLRPRDRARPALRRPRRPLRGAARRSSSRPTSSSPRPTRPTTSSSATSSSR